MTNIYLWVVGIQILGLFFPLQDPAILNAAVEAKVQRVTVRQRLSANSKVYEGRVSSTS